jgi:hypothetical protein
VSEARRPAAVKLRLDTLAAGYSMTWLSLDTVRDGVADLEKQEAIQGLRALRDYGAERHCDPTSSCRSGRFEAADSHQSHR